MLDEIDVGEWVRTDKGEIVKVTSVAKETLGETLGANEYRSIGFCNTEPYVYGNIVKHSKQLIDLIEVGDYVNGHRIVCEIYGEDDNDLYFEIEGGFNSAQYIGEKDIKTILTHEQFETNDYTVGE